MRSILVINRHHLFPGLSPQGFLPADSIDLDGLGEHLFFAERQYMENCSHYKQLIPYLVLHRGEGDDARVLCYQRRAKHTEARLGSLWSVGFGGHIEPLDRTGDVVATHGLMRACAMRELQEETGLEPGESSLSRIGYINSDSQDVSSVHFGVAYKIDLDDYPGDDAALIDRVSAQAEPHQARWIPLGQLRSMTSPDGGPDGGSFENWSQIVIEGAF